MSMKLNEAVLVKNGFMTPINDYYFSGELKRTWRINFGLKALKEQEYNMSPKDALSQTDCVMSFGLGFCSGHAP